MGHGRRALVQPYSCGLLSARLTLIVAAFPELSEKQNQPVVFV